MARGGVRLVAAVIAALSAAGCRSRQDESLGTHPLSRSSKLVRPTNVPLSAVAAIGREIFFDSTLSASGRVSCASCHAPANAYGPAFDKNTVNIDVSGKAVVRATPSLRYAYRTPPFSIGPMLADADDALATRPAANADHPAARKNTSDGPLAERFVAHGGMFWDGRVNTLQDQAMGPLFNPTEMGNRDVPAVAAKLRRTAYVNGLVSLFGAGILIVPDRLVDEAMFAVARFQIEDQSFHPYSSKYDYYLEGRAALTPQEERGLRAFDDPKRGNCAACHADKPGSDGIPPAFTDYEYEALAVPRNPAVARADQYDLGACGPVRTDVENDQLYCGLFRTPSLRNVALRTSFFHNGIYRSLDDVLAFYNHRETHPELVYPLTNGRVAKYDDLPKRYHANVDVTDAPFDRRAGDADPMTAEDIRDIIVFLRTLTDGSAPVARR